MYKPIFVMFCAFLSTPHFAILILNFWLGIYCVLKQNLVKKSLLLYSFLALTLALNLSFEVIFPMEFYYNVVFLLDFLIILILISKNPAIQKPTKIWNTLFIITLLASVVENFLIGSLTSFEGRATMIGYSNPLWAGRDICVACAYYILTKNKTWTFFTVISILILVFFMVARGPFIALLLFILYKTSFRNTLITIIAMPLIIMSVLFLNPASFIYRINEWKNILVNLNNIPLTGYGIQNYKQIPFTNLGIYSHSWLFDYVLAMGLLGFFLAMLTLLGIYKAIKLKTDGALLPALSLPIIHGFTGLTQGSLSSSLVALSVLPILVKFNQSVTFSKKLNLGTKR